MKRFACLLMAVIVLFVAGAALADDDPDSKDMAQTIEEYSKVILEWLIDVYENDPDSFDADYICMFNGYLRMVHSANLVYFAELLYEVKSNPLSGAKTIYDTIDHSTNDSIDDIYQVLYDNYKAWARKEITDKEYCEKTIPLAKTITGISAK